MNGLSCVKGEIHNVLAVLRITGRSNTSSIFSSNSNANNNIEITRHKLVTSFKELHLLLCLQETENKDIHSVDTRIILRPFCDLICSSDIGGIDIMNIVLTSLHKFLLYGLICIKSFHVFEAINNVLLPSIFNVSFFDNSRSDKELIHIRLQEILLELLRNSCGYFLTNDNICLLVNKLFEIRLYHRNYNKTNNCLMVRYTENVIIQMILLVFNKLKELNCKEDNEGFDIKAITKIFKFLTILINPNRIDTTQDLREFGLRCINVSLESSGQYLNDFPPLIKIIQNDLCRQLLINSQTNSFIILSFVLRIIFDLFNYVKKQIRVQLEVFFISIHLRIAQSNSSSFEQKELILESIVEFCREPDLIIGLYTNYDMRVGCTHLFENLLKFLLNKATINIDNDQNGTFKINNLHLIAAEGILAIIDCIARKFIHISSHNKHSDSKEEHERITQEQKRKKLLKVSAKCFNTHLHKSFSYLQDMATLQTPLDAANVAQFLFTNSYLDKVQIGTFLGDNREFNIKVLKAYVQLFDFTNNTPDEAMRSFLAAFFLRGEAQQIGRIVEYFSTKLYNDRNHESSPLNSDDAACILAFSMIQLNTDAHNVQIKNKMTFAEYKRNVKGQNVLKGQKDNGQSFPDQFLYKIYQSITNNEIKVRSKSKDIFNSDYTDIYEYDEEENDSGYSSDNSSMSRSSFFSDPYSYPKGSGIVKDIKRLEWSTCAPPMNGREMFVLLWEPALSILQFHLRYALHPKVLDRVVQGIQTLAKIAHFYQISAAFNAIMHSLCNHLICCLLQFGIQNEILPTTFMSTISTQKDSHLKHRSSSLSSIYSNTSDIDENEYASISVPYFLSAQNMDRTGTEQDTQTSDDSNILAIDIRITYTIKVFFDLSSEYGGLLLTDGWSSVMKVLLWLFHLDLIPHSEFEMEDFTDAQGEALPSLSDPILENEIENVDSDANTLSSWISNAFGSIFADDTNEYVSGNVSVTSVEEEKKGDRSNEIEQFQVHPKCQSIVNSIIECGIGDIFKGSNAYHIKSFVHFIKTLISLSNTECDNTMAAFSFFQLDSEEKKQSMMVSGTTHTITSTDHLPVQTSELMDSLELENAETNTKNALKEDVVCLPLTIAMKIFCLERLSQVMSVNMNRINNNNEIWTLVINHYKSLITAQQNKNAMNENMDSDMIRHSNYFFERITVNILKLCVELTENGSMHMETVTMFLNLFLTLNDSVLVIVGRRIIAGIKLLLNMQSTENKPQIFKCEKDWQIILFLIKKFANVSNNKHKQCCLDAFHLCELISQKHTKIINFNFVLNVLVIFGKYDRNAPIHNTRVIEIILSIHSKLISISNSNETVLGQMWHKTLSNIASFCTNKDYVTRRFAINSLHKALLQYPITITDKKSFIEPYKLLFQTVLLPLLLQLTKIENETREIMRQNEEKSDSDCDDLKLKLLTLIFQVFLHYININILVENDDNFTVLWYNFLNTIRKFILMHKNKSNIQTHASELLKNVFLVFQTNNSGNIFDILSNKTNTNVWQQTWQIMDDVAPALKQEFEQSVQSQ